MSGKLEKPEDRDSLAELVKKVTQFAMLLGGFGKFWRRADHRIFYPKYTKHLIGCHWEWMNDRDNEVRTLDDAALLSQQVQEAAKKWMEKRGFEVKQVPDSRSPATAPTPVPVQNHSKNPKLNTRSVYKPPAAQQAEAEIVNREVAFNQQINALVPQQGNVHFLFAQILTAKRLIQDASTASMKGMVSKSRFEEIRLIFPPLNLQQEFAAHMEAVEKLKAAHRASLSELDALFASLQHRAFRGEL
ncbi:restriction endonuclease subunit S [Microcoleus sp. AR_TQ3_B6]|uniref:restriction endonuclease subunit S n=1 Tax=Microcoleus sp. AR_TQ3_B6 TaxID=3055284 RepID=UPI002FD22F52